MRFRTPIARTPRISTGNQSALTQGDHRAEGEFWRAAIAHRKFLQLGVSPRVLYFYTINSLPYDRSRSSIRPSRSSRPKLSAISFLKVIVPIVSLIRFLSTDTNYLQRKK